MRIRSIRGPLEGSHDVPGYAAVSFLEIWQVNLLT